MSGPPQSSVLSPRLSPLDLAADLARGEVARMHVGVGGSSTNRALHGREIASLDALGRHGEHVRRGNRARDRARRRRRTRRLPTTATEEDHDGAVGPRLTKVDVRRSSDTARSALWIPCRS